MKSLALALFLSVGLGGSFGEASAEIVSIEGDTMLVSLSVEVRASADSVLARLISPGDDTVRLPLLDRGEGVFGIQTEVRRVDYRVVFEIVGPEPARSEPVSLSALGAEFSNDGATTATDPVDDGGTSFSAETRRWGWLALALAAGSLAVLAIWVLGGKDDDDSDEDGSERLESGGEEDDSDQDPGRRSK